VEFIIRITIPTRFMILFGTRFFVEKTSLLRKTMNTQKEKIHRGANQDKRSEDEGFES